MDVLQHLCKEIDKLATSIQDDLPMGGAKDFGDYKYHCGRYRGLIEAKGVIADFAQRVRDGDDEED